MASLIPAPQPRWKGRSMSHDALTPQFYCLVHRHYTTDPRCLVFIAPTEPDALKVLGLVKLEPELYGVDVMWDSALGKVGVQRKVFPGDFLASIHDGRLNKEFAQMKALDFAVLLLEGKSEFGAWTTEGELTRDRTRDKRWTWTRTQHRNFLASVQLRGVAVLHSDDVRDTCVLVQHLRLWTDKGEHSSLDSRPGPTGDMWGTVTSTDFQDHVLQGLPGIGPKQAAAIRQHLGFPLCLRDGIDRAKLMEVPGIGKGKADKIVRLFKR